MDLRTTLRNRILSAATNLARVDRFFTASEPTIQNPHHAHH